MLRVYEVPGCAEVLRVKTGKTPSLFGTNNSTKGLKHTYFETHNWEIGAYFNVEIKKRAANKIQHRATWTYRDIT